MFLDFSYQLYTFLLKEPGSPSILPFSLRDYAKKRKNAESSETLIQVARKLPGSHTEDQRNRAGKCVKAVRKLTSVNSSNGDRNLF